MIEGLKPYPEYKDSNIGWLASVPSHWSILPGKACFSEIYRSNKGMVESTVLSLSFGRIVVKPEGKLHGLVPESFETYQVIEPGDIIIRPTDLQNDWNSLRTSISPHRGIITSAYIALHPRGQMESDFCDRMLRIYDLLKVFYGLGCGLRQNLSWADFKYLPCVLPPPDEQAAIVKFLDYANGKIERAIRAKRKLIGLLNEQKQAIIHRAVTRGLDPNVKLKPSGIPWLGDVPEHWKITRLGRLSRIFNGTTPSRAKPLYWLGGSVPWLSSSKVNEVPVRTPSELVTPTALKECNLTVVPRGSLIIGLVGQGKTRGMCSVLEIDACINQNIAAIVPTTGLQPLFLYYMLVASYSEIREVGRGGNQAAMNCEIVGRLPIADVPESEQLAICSEVQNKTSKMASAIMRIEREIELLREYRTTLTAEVVTGKLDVRDAAKRLPDQTDEPLPVDESLEDRVDDEILEEDEA
jgi:type I restriction enzyme S subunit